MLDDFDSDDDDLVLEDAYCPLCGMLVGLHEPTWMFGPFDTDPDLRQYIEQLMHWDCYAHWRERPRMARQCFEAEVASMKDNPYWGIARLDEEIQLTVNPGFQPQIDVLLAATGSSFRVSFEDWPGWLAWEWYYACAHDLERLVLAGLLPSLRRQFPSAEAIVAAAGMDSKTETRAAKRRKRRS